MYYLRRSRVPFLFGFVSRVTAPLALRRREQAGYVSLSFETISGYGPNGAVIHYTAEEHTARPLGTGSLFLLVGIFFLFCLFRVRLLYFF